MKKLMIVLGAVACAISLQAASMNWATPYTFVDSDPSQGDNDLAFQWAIVEAASADAFSSVTFDKGTLVGATAFDSGTITVTGWGQEMAGSTTTATAGKYYALLVHNDDFSKWGISDAVLATVNSTDQTGNTLMDVTFKNMADDPWSFGSGESMVANVADAVPEPTSGLLLLLGVAGLALRRRRA